MGRADEERQDHQVSLTLTANECLLRGHVQQCPQWDGQHGLQHPEQPADDDDEEDHVGHGRQHDAEHECYRVHVLLDQGDMVDRQRQQPAPERICSVIDAFAYAGYPADGRCAKPAGEGTCLESRIKNVQADAGSGHGVAHAFHAVDCATDSAVVSAEKVGVDFTVGAVSIGAGGHFGDPLHPGARCGVELVGDHFLEAGGIGALVAAGTDAVKDVVELDRADGFRIQFLPFGMKCLEQDGYRHGNRAVEKLLSRILLPGDVRCCPLQRGNGGGCDVDQCGPDLADLLEPSAGLGPAGAGDVLNDVFRDGVDPLFGIFSLTPQAVDDLGVGLPDDIVEVAAGDIVPAGLVGIGGPFCHPCVQIAHQVDTSGRLT